MSVLKLESANSSRPGSCTSIPLIERIQVSTPDAVAMRLAEEVTARRETVGSVLDMGAADGQLGRFLRPTTYTGIEQDAEKIRDPGRGRWRVDHGCAFSVPGQYDIVISNPPYLRNQDLGREWRSRASDSIFESLGVVPDGRSNAYLYFFLWALAKTRSDGLVALLVPAEWQFQPSASPLRGFLAEQGWDWEVIRLPDGVFADVRTTATLTIVDKRRLGSGNRRSVAYAEAGSLYAGRGLSPGSRGVFVLTENERIEAGIKNTEVVPCVTSFRLVEPFSRLTKKTFESTFVDTGRRCWLLRTDGRVSANVLRWLEAAPESVKKNATCRIRHPWYSFQVPPAPALLYSSGFKANHPFFAENTIGAIPVGSIHGIHGPRSSAEKRALRSWLNGRRWKRLVPARDGGLRRIAVGQANHLLQRFRREHA